MSLETWKAEFYPIPAYEVDSWNAVAHSTQKWIGLREENLLRHGCRRVEDDATMIVADENSGFSFEVSGISCALCVWHIDRREVGAPRCGTCPLKLALDARCDETDDLPWRQYTYSGDPEPMIAALKKAAELEAKK